MLSRIETLLGIEGSNQVYEIYLMTLDRLQQKLGVEQIPTELEWIVIEVSVARYNRIGSEGTSSHNVQGESMSWASADDFAPYEKAIKDWMIAQEDATEGVVKFL